jgi:uncharacterized OsmC-like protein
MKISAQVQNSEGSHSVILTTGEAAHSIVIPPKTEGLGSSANGGELLFLALATCYCNDVYREAARKNISVVQVEVVVEGEFGAVGEPARNVAYRVRVKANASESEVRELLEHTDTVAEIQNTLRIATPVVLSEITVNQGA